MTAARSAARSGPRHLVLYDGVCGLCDRTVQFLLAVDRHSRLTFAPLQGSTGELAQRRLEVTADLRTLVFVRDWEGDGETVYFRSTAVLQILAVVGGIWRLASWLRVVPRPLRDATYDFVARHRYRWFGRFDRCKLPSPEQRERFLE